LVHGADIPDGTLRAIIGESEAYCRGIFRVMSNTFHEGRDILSQQLNF
jgi:hypothetical protein